MQLRLGPGPSLSFESAGRAELAGADKAAEVPSGPDRTKPARSRWPCRTVRPVSKVRRPQIPQRCGCSAAQGTSTRRSFQLAAPPRAMANCYCDWAAAEEDLEILGPRPFERRSVPRPCQQLRTEPVAAPGHPPASAPAGFSSPVSEGRAVPAARWQNIFRVRKTARRKVIVCDTKPPAKKGGSMKPDKRI